MRILARFALMLSLIVGAVTTALAAGPSYRLEVAGLACPFCAYGIEKKLNDLDGTAEVTTHIKDGAVIVTMEEGAALDRERAQEAVKEAGFTLNGFERLPEATPD